MFCDVGYLPEMPAAAGGNSLEQMFFASGKHLKTFSLTPQLS